MYDPSTFFRKSTNIGRGEGGEKTRFVSVEKGVEKNYVLLPLYLSKTALKPEIPKLKLAF